MAGVAPNDVLSKILIPYVHGNRSTEFWLFRGSWKRINGFEVLGNRSIVHFISYASYGRSANLGMPDNLLFCLPYFLGSQRFFPASFLGALLDIIVVIHYFNFHGISLIYNYVSKFLFSHKLALALDSLVSRADLPLFVPCTVEQNLCL